MLSINASAAYYLGLVASFQDGDRFEVSADTLRETCAHAAIRCPDAWTTSNDQDLSEIADWLGLTPKQAKAILG